MSYCFWIALYTIITYTFDDTIVGYHKKCEGYVGSVCAKLRLFLSNIKQKIVMYYNNYIIQVRQFLRVTETL